MRIGVFSKQRTFKIMKACDASAAQAILEKDKVSTDELSLYFVGSEKISSLHEKFFQDPSPTDCITFPVDGPKKPGDGHSILGEVFICPEVAFNYAQKRDLPPLEELTLYLVHGLLHLMGYEDLSPEGKRSMRKKEKSCMEYLKRRSLLIKSDE